MIAVLDVGANNGADSVKLSKVYSCRVHAFEPAPAMIKEIQAKIAAGEDIELVQCAVSDYDGSAVFNVDELGDHGCSSLLEFSDNLEHTWPSRDDFAVTSRVEVEVVRLDTYIERAGITDILYLHCDAQGADLQVLMGLGKFAAIVRAGVVEASTERSGALYKGQPLLADVESWLDQNGFKVVGISSNDPWRHEVNVSFERI